MMYAKEMEKILFRTLYIRGKHMNRELILQRFAKIISFKTLSHDNGTQEQIEPFIQLGEYLKTAYPGVHSIMKRREVEGGSLMYKWEAKNPQLPPFAILAHMDVVPVENPDSWIHPPFEGYTDGETIWGRGVNDDKCAVGASLEACELLIAEGFEPNRDMYLLFGHNEEDVMCKHSGAKMMAQILQDENVELEFVWDEGGAIILDPPMGLTNPAAMIGIAEKGFGDLKLIMTGEGGHAAEPPAHTSLADLGNLLSEIQKHPMPPKLIPSVEGMLKVFGENTGGFLGFALRNIGLCRPLVINILGKNNLTSAMVRTTIVPTICQVGTASNVLPQLSTAVLNIRLLPGDTLEEVKNHISKLARKIKIEDKLSFETLSYSEPVRETDSSTVTYQILSDMFQEQFKGVVIAPYLVTGATDSREYSKVAKDIFRIYPFKLTTDELSTMHGTNENIKIESYLFGITCYKDFIKRQNEREV